MKWTCGRNAHADSALLAPGRSPRRFKRMVQVCKRCTGIIQESSTSIGQLNTARLTAKQLHIKFALDRLDLLAERRLLHAEPLGGSGDVPFLRNYNEITEMSQL